MTGTEEDTMVARVLRGLEHGAAPVRLRAALAAGTTPDPGYVDGLVERCAAEPEPYVRETLTWALTRHAPAMTLPRLIGELRSQRARARGQALHTLSKIGDRRAWPAITRTLLTDGDDEVARCAWRAAVVLVPSDEAPGLADVLATQLGRGGREMRLSLSRALIALGGEVVVPVLRTAARDADPRAREHAADTERLLRDPDAAHEFAIGEARRVVALGPAGQEE